MAKKITAKQRAARKAASQRLKQFNKERRSEATQIARAAKAAAGRKAASINRAQRKKTFKKVSRTADRADDGMFF